MKKFQRRREDFICDECGANIKGDGYTNHCPKCLFSKHVDNNPGDRLNVCRGSMKPIATELTRGGFNIIYQCLSCGESYKNKSVGNDNIKKLIELSKEPY